MQSKPFLLFLALSLIIAINQSTCLALAKKETQRLALKSNEKAQLVAIFQTNDALHAAFFNYNGTAVQDAAEKLRAAMGKVESNEIKKIFSPSHTKLAEISAKADRKLNDQLYNEVSTSLIKALKTYDLGADYNEYYCPMIEKSWVQNSKKVAKVQNPYAPNMPSCGAKVTSF